MRREIIDRAINPDVTAVDRVREIAQLPDILKVAALNDLHHGLQETPVSVAAATKNTIYLELTSNVINCGMSVITTELTEDQITTEFVSKFCSELRKQDSAHKPTQDDIEKFLSHGSEHVIERFGLDQETREHIENGGSMFAPDEYPDDVSDLVPPWLLRYGGTYQDTPITSLASNHFIEFQTVDEIVDTETADEWGLSKDQVVIFMHGDYALTFYMNWHHANRRKFREQIGLVDRTKMQLSKAAFHLWRDGLKNFPGNWQKYNSEERYTGFDLNTEPGKHLSKVIYAAMNFGYANRLLSSICIEQSINEIIDDPGEIQLLWDVGHDTIQEETIDGETYWIHRKGAAKAVPDKPALISGSYNMNSFLGKGLSTASSYLNSYDHGCSNVIEYFESNDRLSEIDVSTRMFDYPDGTTYREIRHVDPGPIEAVVDTLTADEVLSEVAWLRPIVNIGE